jgi:uncharacterized protein (TIGR03067 family)
MLAKRLARHGAVLSAGPLAAALVQGATSACVPTAVVSATIRAASLFAAGQVAATGAISVKVVALAEGVLRSMWMTNRKSATAVLLAVLFLGAGLGTAGLLSRPPVAERTRGRAEEKDAKKALGALQGAWRVTKLDIEDGEVREGFEKLGKVVIKGDKATLLWDLAGKGAGKDAITWAEFTIRKVGLGKPPAPIDLRLDKFMEVQGLKPKIGATLLGVYSLEGATLKLFFGEEARPKAFPAKAKQGVLTLQRVGPAGKKGAARPRGKVEPAGTPLAAVLKANKATYKLDLGGRSAERFRKVATARDRFDAGGPSSPTVDLVLEVRNTSAKEVQLFTLPDLAEVKLSLKGPDALTVHMQGPFQLDRRLPKPITLAPGKAFTRPIRSLNHGHRDIEFRSYWLAPGDYTLTASFHTAMVPPPAGAVLYDGRLGEPQLKGFGVVTVTTAPLTLKVVR